MVRSTLRVSPGTAERRFDEASRPWWELEADEAGIDLARRAFQDTLEHYEPVISRDRLSRARTSPTGIAAGYYRLLLAARYAKDFRALQFMAFGPADFARRLMDSTPIPFVEAMLAEQVADCEEDIAQSELAFSDYDGPEVWTWIERADTALARQKIAILAAKQHARARGIPRPADLRYRKPAGLVLGAVQ